MTYFFRGWHFLLRIRYVPKLPEEQEKNLPLADWSQRRIGDAGWERGSGPLVLLCLTKRTTGCLFLFRCDKH